MGFTVIESLPEPVSSPLGGVQSWLGEIPVVGNSV